MRLIERVWAGSTAGGSLARALLAPVELLYGAAVGIRSRLYDADVLHSTKSSVPVVSVGNLTVGGTGKTPVAAWIASRLSSLGKAPAIVLRGYGSDEPLVHRRLNPSVLVIVNPDRNAGIREALSRGANVIVLDDAFQHRRAGRSVDLVLMSADDWTGRQRLLPAGPYREPFSAIGRASAVAITRKAASDGAVTEIMRAIKSVSPDMPVAVLSLRASELIGRDGSALPISTLAGAKVAAVAAVGNAEAFFRQLEDAGATVTRMPFPDHHSFSAADVVRIEAGSRGLDRVVCTLKDAVKLEALWPAADTRLWYVSLAVGVEHGEAVIDDMLERLA